MSTDSLTVLASFFLPLLVDVAIRLFKLSNVTAQKVVAGVLALCIALASELSVRPAIDIGDLVSRFAVVFALSQIVYRNIYKDTLVNKSISGL